jgi:glycerol-3-phosphate dehydrogenase subunit C
MKRVAVAEKTFDVGEYLLRLLRTGKLRTEFGPVEGHAVYFPPCHQREQEFGQPYLELLGLISGFELEAIQSSLHCCGLAGVMGFKRDFHQASIQLGSRLIEKIRQMNPERIVTDCLSCRLQFSQLLPYPVVHPMEVLRAAYEAAG